MGDVLRLTGLPAPQRCPSATVRRTPGVIELRFQCVDGSEMPFDVDVAVLGPGADPEAEELRLLAQLGEMGYDVRRLTP
ncbi:MAG: hypothetical protein QOG77_1809 [Solirubrobacteraceae bacterium]|jgi:hypothetical protein|nr:hypothetical protein [Solirubrobacteraceae bacterium]